MLKKKVIAVPRTYVSHINPVNCVNCGTCRDYCPTGAIAEYQREICRICPDCTDRSAMSVDEMKEFSTKQACTTACPLGISPQGYIGLTRVGRTRQALEHIWKHNPLPSVCGRICHHPCEQDCKRGVLVDEPISIRGIKRYLSDNVELSTTPYPEIHEEKIAVIGAGPAGLTAAHYLLLMGYGVVVFEANDVPGGMMYRAIPEFRLARDAMFRDVENLQKMGMEIRYNEKVDPSRMNALLKEYDAVVVAAGRNNGRVLSNPGADKTDIVTALDYLDQINNQPKADIAFNKAYYEKHPTVVVVGGGDVAMDCARTAVRLGAKSVTAVCMETGDDVPGHPWEIEEANAEGITLEPGWAPVSFPGEGEAVSAIALCKCESGRDASGKLNFRMNENETRTLDADQVILAIGQASDSFWGAYDNNEKVFFAGDIRNRICSVVDSMASGKAVAHVIDNKFQGRELKDPLDLRVLNHAPIDEKIYPATRLRVDRPAMPVQEKDARMQNFEEVEGAFEDDVVTAETWRCLRCGFQMSDPKKCIGCGVCMEVCPKGDVITMVAI